jgi:AraC-like DNA-binding protein
MSELALTLSSAYVNAFLDAVALDPEYVRTFTTAAGIPSSALNEAGGRVTESQFVALYRAISRHLDDEFPNLLSHPLRGGAMKFIGLSIINAATLKVALYRYTKLTRLMVHDFELQLLVDRSVAQVLVVEPETGRCCKRLAIEMILKVVHGLASWLIAREIPLLQVDFALEPVIYEQEYQNLFPGPVSFNAAQSGLSFSAKYLDMPVQRNANDLKAFLARQPQDWIFVPFKERLAKHQVREYLIRHNFSITHIEQVAKALNMSSRTLFRRLESEGSTFQHVKDELRRDIAVARLTNTHDPMLQIASELGFSDISSFYRAFKSWTGTTPSSYRQDSEQRRSRRNASSSFLDPVTS